MKIINTENSDPVEVLEALEADADTLNTVQQMNLEYLRKNLKVKDRESFEELKEELAAVDSLKPKHMLKLLEILPTYEQEVRTLFSKERIKLDDEEVNKITEICRSFSTN